ncbi:MAG: hypothetical protein AAF804_09455 [Bacteroidota bacterium]
MLDKDWSLDSEEMNLLEDLDVLPRKQRVCHKLEQALAELGRALQPHPLPEGILPGPALAPKLSRGENYHRYAYRVLDQPRYHRGEDLFLFRTLILWGHPIGFHLIMTGALKTQWESALIEFLPQLSTGYFLSRQASPWIWEAHHPEQISLDQASEQVLKDVIAERAFIKVSYYLVLAQLDQLIPTGQRIWGKWQAFFRHLAKN